MSDRAKIWIAICFLIASIVLPIIVLLSVWYYFDFSTGLIWASIVFIFFGAGALVLLFRVKNLTSFSSSLPYLFATIYAFLPDGILGPFDDGVILGVGAVLSYILEIRRNPGAPRWVLIFPLMALIYIFIGGFFPGPIDEFIVGGLLYLAYLLVNTRKNGAEHLEIPENIDD